MSTLEVASPVECIPVVEVDSHPLLFTFRDVISGDGFLAGITLSGRILLTEEDGKWWIFGVRPAAIAESGDSPKDALSRFRKRYKEVLFDIAGECRTFEHFKNEIERFFFEADLEEEHKWEQALRKLRCVGARRLAELSYLEELSPEKRPSQITVERLDSANARFMPTDNISNMTAIAA